MARQAHPSRRTAEENRPDSNSQARGPMNVWQENTDGTERPHLSRESGQRVSHAELAPARAIAPPRVGRLVVDHYISGTRAVGLLTTLVVRPRHVLEVSTFFSAEQGVSREATQPRGDPDSAEDAIKNDSRQLDHPARVLAVTCTRWNGNIYLSSLQVFVLEKPLVWRGTGQTTLKTISATTGVLYSNRAAKDAREAARDAEA